MESHSCSRRMVYFRLELDANVELLLTLFTSALMDLPRYVGIFFNEKLAVRLSVNWLMDASHWTLSMGLSALSLTFYYSATMIIISVSLLA